jgi:hypothetical protein
MHPRERAVHLLAGMDPDVLDPGVELALEAGALGRGRCSERCRVVLRGLAEDAAELGQSLAQGGPRHPGERRDEVALHRADLVGEALGGGAHAIVGHPGAELHPLRAHELVAGKERAPHVHGQGHDVGRSLVAGRQHLACGAEEGVAEVVALCVEPFPDPGGLVADELVDLAGVGFHAVPAPD